MAVLGIDLGTSKLSVAVFCDGSADVLRNDIGNRGTPSCVYADPSLPPEEWETGETALRKQVFEPSRTIRNSKYLFRISSSVDIGALSSYRYEKIEFINGEYTFVYDDANNYVTPTVVAHTLLKEAKRIAEVDNGYCASKAVICVPNYFTEQQRILLKQTALGAGLPISDIVSDTSAAALCYAFRKNPENETIIIVDIGGGGGNLCIASIMCKKVTIVATSNIRLPGGEDFNSRLMDHVMKVVIDQYGVNITDPRSIAILRMHVDLCKQKLSRCPTAVIKCYLPCLQRDITINVSRLEFEFLCSDLFDIISSCTQRIISESEVSEIHTALLVGGSTRIPRLRDAIHFATKCDKVSTVLHAEEAMALGAALMGAKVFELCGLNCRIPLPHPASWYEGAPICIPKETVTAVKTPDAFEKPPSPVTLQKKPQTGKA